VTVLDVDELFLTANTLRGEGRLELIDKADGRLLCLRALFDSVSAQRNATTTASAQDPSPPLFRLGEVPGISPAAIGTALSGSAERSLIGSVRAKPRTALRGFGNPDYIAFPRPGRNIGGNAVSQSLAKVNVHIIFSTKNRKPWLADDEIRSQLFAYMATVLKENVDSPAILINGV
jgi:hypothetical protein